MYWYGPQFGFTSRLDMLREEFGGRCAYCGEAGLNLQAEHVMPQSRFPYDSYFNLLPSCSRCNSQKGTQAKMSIHADAYAAYDAYVGGLKVPHVYQTIKKGLLNLWQHGTRIEAHLRMIGENLLNVAGAQAAPRNLGRYLAARLKCGARALSGRHTALYRSIVLPDYVKPSDPVRNHAVDAILLACDFPSAPAFDSGRYDPWKWRQRVLEASPELVDGLPVVEGPAERVDNFERDLGDGYLGIDLSAFNWNWKRRSGCGTDPVGRTADGQPAKRIPAQDVLKKLPGIIPRIVHSRLRRLLESDPDNARRNLIVWLQKSVTLPQGDHPSDRTRRQMLEKFRACPPESILSDEEEDQIPYTIGVRCLQEGGKAKYHISRDGKPGLFAADRQYQVVYVGYRMKDGEVDRSRPIEVYVDQTGAVLQGRGVRRPVLLAGRPLGAEGKLDLDALRGWLCTQLQLETLYELSQGCVVEKMDGTQFQLRNFDTKKSWAQASAFRDIRRVLRSPLVV